MNIYKGLLFLEGFRIPTEHADDAEASGYGNRVASQQAFPALGHARAGRHRTADAAFADDLCPSGGCG